MMYIAHIVHEVLHFLRGCQIRYRVPRQPTRYTRLDQRPPPVDPPSSGAWSTDIASLTDQRYATCSVLGFRCATLVEVLAFVLIYLYLYISSLRSLRDFTVEWKGSLLESRAGTLCGVKCGGARCEVGIQGMYPL